MIHKTSKHEVDKLQKKVLRQFLDLNQFPAIHLHHHQRFRASVPSVPQIQAVADGIGVDQSDVFEDDSAERRPIPRSAKVGDVAKRRTGVKGRRGGNVGSTFASTTSSGNGLVNTLSPPSYHLEIGVLHLSFFLRDVVEIIYDSFHGYHFLFSLGEGRDEASETVLDREHI